MIASTHSPSCVLIAGATGAIGQAFVNHYLALATTQRVYALSRHTPAAVDAQNQDPRLIWVQCDVTQDADLQALADKLSSGGVKLNALINTVGMLHESGKRPEKSLAQLSRENLQRSFDINAFSAILLLKAIAPFLDKIQPAWGVSLSARVGSIADNGLGGWYSYRAAKAAQNQLFKTAAIELKRSHPLLTCLQLHPGTVDSGLSQPFQAGLPAGQLLSPENAVAHLMQVIASKTPQDSGSFWDWKNQAVPW